MSLTRNLSLKKLVRETEGMSGADLRALCVEAGMNAIQKERNKVRAVDFQKALKKMRNRLTEADRKEPEQPLYS
jgi:proteasome regulatory subunit